MNNGRTGPRKEKPHDTRVCAPAAPPCLAPRHRRRDWHAACDDAPAYVERDGPCGRMLYPGLRLLGRVARFLHLFVSLCWWSRSVVSLLRRLSFSTLLVVRLHCPDVLQRPDLPAVLPNVLPA